MISSRRFEANANKYCTESMNSGRALVAAGGEAVRCVAEAACAQQLPCHNRGCTRDAVG